MKVYVASNRENIDNVRRLQSVVRDAGHEVIFDWTGSEGKVLTHQESWYDTANSREKGKEISEKEINACIEADLIIVICPEAGKGLGCWIELGAGLAAGTRIWIINPARDVVFWQHPLVTRFDTLDEVEAELLLC